MNKRKTSARRSPKIDLEKIIANQSAIDTALGRLLQKVEDIRRPPAMVGEHGHEVKAVHIVEPPHIRDVGALDVVIALSEKLVSIETQLTASRADAKRWEESARSIDKKCLELQRVANKLEHDLKEDREVLTQRGQVYLQLMNALKDAKAVDLSLRFKKQLLKILSGPAI